MLILTRRPIETVCIGDDITVTVLGVVGNQVRFGISAPKHISVDRAEIRERKLREARGEDVDGNVALPPPSRKQFVPASEQPPPPPPPPATGSAPLSGKLTLPARRRGDK